MEMQSQSIGKLTEALSKAQRVINGATKDGNNPFHKSKYTTLESVWNACKQQLTENGFAVIQTMDVMWDRPVLVTTLAHLSGEYIKSILPLNPVKNDPQSMGGAITYARRYALAAIAGVCPTDDDAESAMNRNGVHHEPEDEEERPLTEDEGAQLDYYLNQLTPSDIDDLCKKLRIKTIYEMKKKSLAGSIDWCMKKASVKTKKTA
jgi:hypothetical protein